MIFLFNTFLSESDKLDFSDLYHQYKDLVYYISNNILCDKYKAEDAASETFYKLAKHYSKIKKLNRDELIYYVAASAKNTALTMYKKNSLINDNTETTDEIDLIPDKEDVYERLIQRIDYSEMIDVLNNLSDIQKMLFIYKYYYGYSTKKISKITNISENTISVNLYRAKKKLLNFIKRGDEENEKK